MKYLTGFVAGLLLSGSMFGLVKASETPNCPQEDSCSVSYEHGQWTITEDQP